MAFGCSRCNAQLRSKWLCAENAHTFSSEEESFVVLATFASLLLESFNFLLKGYWHSIWPMSKLPIVETFHFCFQLFDVFDVSFTLFKLGTYTYFQRIICKMCRMCKECLSLHHFHHLVVSLWDDFVWIVTLWKFLLFEQL